MSRRHRAEKREIPALPRQMIVRTTESDQPRFEIILDVLRKTGFPDGLGCKQLNRSERVLHPVVQLVQQRLLMKGRTPKVRDILERADHSVDGSILSNHRVGVRQEDDRGSVRAVENELVIAHRLAGPNDLFRGYPFGKR